MEGFFKGLTMLNREFTLSENQVTFFLNDKNKPFIDHVIEYYSSASLWSGLKLPLVEDINDVGYNLFYAKYYKESIELFKYGISLYPDDTNLYDSIGEIQSGVGDKAAALKYYSEGLEALKKQKGNLTDAVYNRKLQGFEKNIKAFTN